MKGINSSVPVEASIIEESPLLEDTSVVPIARIETVKVRAEAVNDLKELNQASEPSLDLGQLSVPKHESWPKLVELVYGSGPAVYQAYALHELASSPENFEDGVAVLKHAAGLERDPVYLENLGVVDEVVLGSIKASALDYISERVQKLRVDGNHVSTTAEVHQDFERLHHSATENIKETLAKGGLQAA